MIAIPNHINYIYDAQYAINGKKQYHVSYILVTRNEKVISKSVNFGYNCAEQQCLRYAKKKKLLISKPENLTLYSLRVNTKNELKNAKPCNKCYQDCIKYGIKRVVYSDDDGNLIKKSL